MRTTPDCPLEERKKKISQFQTDVAKILNMERGISKEITGRKHLTPYEFKKMLTRLDIAEKMALEKPEIVEKVVKKLTLKKLKEMNQEVRDELKKLGASRENYAELEAIKKAVEQKLKAKEPITLENIDCQFSAFLETFKNDQKKEFRNEILENAINSIQSLTYKPKPDGTSSLFGKFTKARENGSYDFIIAVAEQMKIAFKYGLNLRVAELEKLRGDQAIANRNATLEKMNAEFIKIKRERDQALKKAEEWKEKVEKIQDDLLIERKPIQIKYPPIDTEEIEIPIKKPSSYDLDFGR